MLATVGSAATTLRRLGVPRVGGKARRCFIGPGHARRNHRRRLRPTGGSGDRDGQRLYWSWSLRHPGGRHVVSVSRHRLTVRRPVHPLPARRSARHARSAADPGSRTSSRCDRHSRRRPLFVVLLAGPGRPPLQFVGDRVRLIRGHPDGCLGAVLDEANVEEHERLQCIVFALGHLQALGVDDVPQRLVPERVSFVAAHPVDARVSAPTSVS